MNTGTTSAHRRTRVAPTALGIDAALVRQAAVDGLKKLDPRRVVRNPVMFVVWVGAVLTTGAGLGTAFGEGGGDAAFELHVSVWLWFTVYFANVAEALAEGRGRANAQSLRAARRDVVAKRLDDPRRRDARTVVPAPSLRKGDVFLVEAGDIIPRDGEVIEGVAAVNESAITGESAPVIRQSGGDLSSVTGGTRLVSDWLVVRVSADPGESFLDRMIGLVEGARRQKTPNEIALDILLAFLTIVFLIVVVTLDPYSRFAVTATGAGTPVGIVVLVALLVCLIPTTIGGLLSAIGIAGMDRMVRANVIAKSGRAVEAAGDVSVLLLDKTGTITFGNREASEFLPVAGVRPQQVAAAALWTSLSDDTPEGRSIVRLARASGSAASDRLPEGAAAVPFSAQLRMSGVRIDGRDYRKGAPDAVVQWVRDRGGSVAPDINAIIERIARDGATPMLVAEHDQVLGAIRLKDILKPGIREKFAQLRRAGIRTVMITGDNPLTAAAIAAEAGVDSFLAEATPERKLAYIRDMQAAGEVVAMTGDGTNDAPALAQAEVAVAMNAGTQAAKEAANLVDLDSDPTKLLQVVVTGKEMLMTRGSLTTFSLANDLAKYFAIIPAAFAATYPSLNALNVMRLHSPESAILSAIIFNALIIVALIPLALRGVRFQAVGAVALLQRNMLVYGLGGIIAPFIGIKGIDMILVALGGA